MALMAATARTVVFGARDNMHEITLGSHMPRYGLRETGPSRAAFVFICAIEKWQVARGADKSARAVFLIKWTTARRLSILFKQYTVGLFRGLTVIAPELFATALLREHAEIKGNATSVARLCSTARRFMEPSSHHQRFRPLADGMVLGKRMT